MKTIIMLNPVMEAESSRFPKVNINFDEAQNEAASLGARLPTSEEYDRLYAICPWPHAVYEWTSTQAGIYKIVRGGSWFFRPAFARASTRDAYAPASRFDFIGFRCARDVEDGAEVPKGWTVI